MLIQLNIEKEQIKFRLSSKQCFQIFSRVVKVT